MSAITVDDLNNAFQFYNTKTWQQINICTGWKVDFCTMTAHHALSGCVCLDGIDYDRIFLRDDGTIWVRRSKHERWKPLTRTDTPAAKAPSPDRAPPSAPIPRP